MFWGIITVLCLIALFLLDYSIKENIKIEKTDLELKIEQDKRTKGSPFRYF